MNFKITFNLDGTGIYYNPNEPIHLDSLITWAYALENRIFKDLRRDEKPDDFALPFEKKQFNDLWLWQASVLFPKGKQIEDITYIRKRLRENKIELTKGSPNTMSGVYRGYNIPLALLLCNKMVAYANGDIEKVDKLLKHIKHLGKKRKSRIISIEFKEMKDNYSLVKKGAMRFLPDQKGTRSVRLRPPYWNNCDKVLCCEIGADYSITTGDFMAL